MVLYYGLLALETANNTVAAATASSTSSSTALAMSRGTSNRTSLSSKKKHLTSSNVKMPLSSSTSSSNSWIYTEDLRKRFEERFADYRYVFVPVYIDRKSNKNSFSTTTIPLQRVDYENSWIYSRPLRDHLYYSTSKMSLPLKANLSSSSCCVTNQAFMRDEIPGKKSLKAKFFKRSFSTREKSPNQSSSSSSLPFSLLNSVSSYAIPASNLARHRNNDVVEEEDDEGADEENHSIPLIKQKYVSYPSKHSNLRNREMRHVRENPDKTTRCQHFL